MFKSIVSALSIFALVFVQTANAANWTNGLSIEEVSSRKAAAIAELEEFSEVAKSLKENIDRTQFDIDELLDSLDYDAEQIIDFVESVIFYEPYVGMLRGTLGTLLGRAGNSLDQSVLLASMLRDAGYEARISQFELDATSAERLVDSTQIERALPEHVFKDGTNVAGLVEDKFPELAVERDSELEAYKAEVDETFAYILDALNENGIEIGDENFRANLISEAQDYFAVEYRETNSEGWQLVHPAAADLFGEGFDFAASQNFEDAVPANLQHQFRFSVRMRANTGGEAPTDTTLFSWTRPTSNLTGVDLEFTIIPLNTDAIREALTELFEQGAFTQEDYLQVLAETQNLEDQVFVPIWNGAPAEGALAFDLNGTVVPLEASMQQASELFRTLGGAVGDAQSALSGLGTDEEFEIRTESVWIEYAFLEPGEDWEVHEREIYAADPEREVWEAPADVYTLTGVYSFMLAMGEVNNAYLTSELLTQSIAHNTFLENGVQHFPQLTVKDIIDLAVENPAALKKRHEFLRLYSNFDTKFQKNLTHVYRGKPSLVVFNESIQHPDHSGGVVARFVVDIFRNDRLAVHKPSKVITHDVETSMKIGIWESIVEGEMAKDYGRTFGEFLDTSTSAFETLSEFREKEESDPAIVSHIQSLKQRNIDSEKVHDEVLRHLKPQELAIFASPREQYENFSWWRIDPQNGTALAVGVGGQGMTLSEYMLVGAAGSTIVAGYTVYMISLSAVMVHAICIFLGMTSEQEYSNHYIRSECADLKWDYLRQVYSGRLQERAVDAIIYQLYLSLHRRYG